MFRTPLKNSKSVNKPFKSPFDSSTPTKKDLRKSDKANSNPSVGSTASSSRSIEAKRILQLDENEPERKRPKLSEIDNEKMKKLVPEDATKSDLFVLKRKIFEMRQELDCLKSREMCTKKHDPKELRNCIDKWRSACQSALEMICSELTERNGTSTSITEVLHMLGIPETIVHYSEAEDMFV